MSWFYVGGDSQHSGGSTDISITHGLSLKPGDLVLAYVHINDIGTITASDPGWNNPINERTDVAETSAHALFWMVAKDFPATFNWTQSTAENWRVIVKAFRSSRKIIKVSAPAKSHYQDSNFQDLPCNAPQGRTMLPGYLSVVFGGKDARSVGNVPYTSANNGYVGVIGNREDQETAAAHKIIVEAETLSGNVTIDSASADSDQSYSVHIAFDAYDPKPAKPPALTGIPTAPPFLGLKQPLGPLKLARTPLTIGMAGAWDLRDFTTAKENLAQTKYGPIERPQWEHSAPRQKDYRYGRGLWREVKTNTTKSYIELMQNYELPTEKVTILYVRTPNDTINRQQAAFGVGTATGSSGRRCGSHCPWNDGTVYWDFGNTGDGRATWAGYSKVVGKLDVFVFYAARSAIGGRGQEIWYNGEREATNGSFAQTRTEADAPFHWGNGNTDDIDAQAGDNTTDYILAVWNRGLSYGEIRMISLNPWIIFEPAIPRFPMPKARRRTSKVFV